MQKLDLKYSSNYFQLKSFKLITKPNAGKQTLVNCTALNRFVILIPCLVKPGTSLTPILFISIKVSVLGLKLILGFTRHDDKSGLVKRLKFCPQIVD